MTSWLVAANPHSTFCRSALIHQLCLAHVHGGSCLDTHRKMQGEAFRCCPKKISMLFTNFLYVSFCVLSPGPFSAAELEEEEPRKHQSLPEDKSDAFLSGASADAENKLSEGAGSAADVCQSPPSPEGRTALSSAEEAGSVGSSSSPEHVDVRVHRRLSSTSAPVDISTSASYSQMKEAAFASHSPTTMPLPPSPIQSSSPAMAGAHSMSPSSLPLPESRTSFASSHTEASDSDVDPSGTVARRGRAVQTFGQPSSCSSLNKSPSLSHSSFFSDRVSPSSSSPAIISPVMAAVARRQASSTGSSPDMADVSSGSVRTKESRLSSATNTSKEETSPDHSEKSETRSPFSVDHEADGRLLHQSESEGSLHDGADESLEMQASVDAETGNERSPVPPSAAAAEETGSEPNASEMLADNLEQPPPASGSVPEHRPVKTSGEASSCLSSLSPTRDILSPLSSEFLCIPADEVRVLELWSCFQVRHDAGQWTCRGEKWL